MRSVTLSGVNSHIVNSPASSPSHVESSASSPPHVESPASSPPHVESPTSSPPHVESPDSSPPHVQSPASSSPRVHVYSHADTDNARQYNFDESGFYDEEEEPFLDSPDRVVEDNSSIARGESVYISMFKYRKSTLTPP